ncbi:UNVERIFIED_CONTAM: hypothetical protein K2H54_065909 [Gekko kuhli]
MPLNLMDYQNFCKLLSETEDWLYEKGEDQPKQVYMDNLAGLKKFGTPIMIRYQEAEERSRLLDELGNAVQHYARITDEYRNEPCNHIDETEINRVEKYVQETMKCLSNVIHAQAKQSLDQHPVVHTDEIKGKLRELHNVCEPIVTQLKSKVDSPK